MESADLANEARIEHSNQDSDHLNASRFFAPISGERSVGQLRTAPLFVGALSPADVPAAFAAVTTQSSNALASDTIGITWLPV
jgi:hypothetical protein